MIVAYVPQNMKGTPTGRRLSPQEIQESIVEDLDFEPVKQVWNEYKLPNGIILKLRLELTRVSKTDKYTDDGTPIYTTQTQVIPQIKLPKELIRKIKSRESRRRPVTPVV